MTERNPYSPTPPTSESDVYLKHQGKLVLHSKKPRPQPDQLESDWRERIEIAKEAMEQGKKIRKGKPVVFPRRFPPNKQR